MYWNVVHATPYCNARVDVLFRLNSNLDVASRVNAEVITKPEPVTLRELFSYMNQTSSKVLYLQYLIHLIR